MKNKKNKISLAIIWFFYLIWIIFSIFLYLKWFSLSDLKFFVWNNLFLISIIFLIIFSLRVLLFIPSTIIIISLWFLTNNFLLTFLISIIWVIIWLIETYFIWYFLNKWVDKEIENTKIYKKIKPYLLKFKENWFKATLFWAFFPFLPTDIICYSAWFVKYNFKNFLIAWILWEFSIIFLYSYLWELANKYISELNYIIIWILIFIWIYYFFKKIIN